MRRLVIACGLLAACKNDSSLVTEEDPVDLPQPKACIAVDPPSIEFGALNPANDPPRTEFVTIRSTCEADLEVHGLALADAGEPFDVGSLGSIVIAPGSTTDFTVTFAPVTAGESASRVLIDSNDADQPQATVDVSGTGIAPVIELTPMNHDFGEPFLGCDLNQPWTIRNVGTDDLRVTDLELTRPTPDFSMTSVLALPFTLVPGAQTTVDVDVHALHDLQQTAYFTVSSNDPRSPDVTATATVEPRPYRHRQESWDQPIRTGADVLFVVDNSCSMYEEQTNLADNFQVFVDTLTAADSDWRLAVITTDNTGLGRHPSQGEFLGPVITRNTADPASEFSSQALGADVDGSATEVGLETAWLSTQPGGDGGAGGDFWRDEATLSVVILSDENEQGITPVADYVNGWFALKGGASELVRVHAIVGDVPQSPCIQAEPARRYVDAVNLTGGQFVSICATDWAVNLESVALGSITERQRFALAEHPVPETIDIHVDGVRVVGGWAYEGAGNSVVFDPDEIPPGGALVRIDYEVMPDCGG